MSDLADSSFKFDHGMRLDLPADFSSKIASTSCSKDCVTLLLTLFHLLQKQEFPTCVLDAYILSDAVFPILADSMDRYEIALAEALVSGMLLTYTEFHHPDRHYLLPGTPEGNQVMHDLINGTTTIKQLKLAQPVSLQPRANIFELYEQNIGPLTPMIADQLKQDEADYPSDWVEDAIREAVQHNARNWKYVSAILKNWKERGRGNNQSSDGNDIDKYRRLGQELKKRD